MSGLRVGYIVTRSPILHDRIPKLLRCTINGVNSLAQWAALAAVNGDQSSTRDARRIQLRRDILVSALRYIPGVRPFVPRGAFFVWAELDPSVYERLEVADADALSDKLATMASAARRAMRSGRAIPMRCASPSAATRPRFVVRKHERYESRNSLLRRTAS